VSTSARARLLRGAGFILLCALGGFAAYWAVRPAPPAIYPETAPPAAAAPASKAAVIPQELPAMPLARLQGGQGTLQDFRGHLLVVNFWATWCEPCRREIPLLQRLRSERSKDGLEVVGIAIDHAKIVQQFAEDQKISYPILVGEKGGLEMVEALGMDMVLPFSVFADRQGRIVALKIGELHREEAEAILDRLTDLDQGRVDIATVRRQIATSIFTLGRARAAHTASGPN
jgi:thiol-disulfide isomerase/thioredoxin